MRPLVFIISIISAPLFAGDLESYSSSDPFRALGLRFGESCADYFEAMKVRVAQLNELTGGTKNQLAPIVQHLYRSAEQLSDSDRRREIEDYIRNRTPLDERFASDLVLTNWMNADEIPMLLRHELNETLRYLETPYLDKPSYQEAVIDLVDKIQFFGFGSNPRMLSLLMQGLRIGRKYHYSHHAEAVLIALQPQNPEFTRRLLLVLQGKIYDRDAVTNVLAAINPRDPEIVRQLFDWALDSRFPIVAAKSQHVLRSLDLSHEDQAKWEGFYRFLLKVLRDQKHNWWASVCLRKPWVPKHIYDSILEELPLASFDDSAFLTQQYANLVKDIIEREPELYDKLKRIANNKTSLSFLRQVELRTSYSHNSTR